jgi:hypothetical protein
MPIRLALLALLAALLVVAPAQAGAPGTWTQLGDANLANIDEATLARTPDNVLHVVWTIPAASNDTLVHAAVSPNGATAAPNVIQSGWAGISSVPDLITTPAGLQIFYGGIRTTNSGETNDNLNTATAGPDGASWSLVPGTVAKGDSAYASDMGAALLNDGTPIQSWGGTGSGVFVHRGLSEGTPNFPLQGQLGGCCGYSPDIGVDPKTGETFVVWYSNATNNFGVFAQSLDPATGAPSGSPKLMPGSTTLFNGSPNSSQMLQRTPIVGRPGGGVYVVYPGGYPTTKQVRLWHVAGDKSTVVANSKNNHIASVAADPEGHIWVLWVDRGSQPLVFAARSNKDVTKFGPAVKAGAPKGQSSAYKIDGNASSGALDVVALFGGPSSQQAQWHTQILPGLGIKASPSKIKRGNSTAVKFTVTDPDAVKGAKVSAGGKSATTNASGVATITLGPTKSKSIKATASKGGYASGSTKVKTKK